MMESKYEPGDIFQVTENHGRDGWIGAFVLATEIKSWGIMGFVHTIKTHDEAMRAYIRLPWRDIVFVGKAMLVPKDDFEVCGGNR